MTSFIGHFHPLLVHLPIGILLLAYVLEGMARWFRQDQVRPAVHWSLVLGMAVSVLSVWTGWLLAADGGYEEYLLQRHRWLGVATAGLFVLVWLFRQSPWYFTLFSLGIFFLIATGHYGGSLTHGAGYLFASEGVNQEVVAMPNSRFGPETPIFKGFIEPVLQKKCVSCHRPEKRKGGLELSTEAGIMAGGKHGKTIAPGLPDSCSMLQRLHLPLHDDKHMPPSGKPQLSDTEIRLIEWWIASGAGFQSLVKDYPMPDALSEALTAQAPTNPVFALSVPAASTSAIEKLKSLQVHVQTMGEGKPWLAVSLAGQQYISRDIWEALGAVSTQVADLDVSHTALSDPDFSGKVFPHLVRINLSHTKVGNSICAMLQHSPYLESINLTNTLTDSTLQAILPKLKYLRKLFIWQTNISPESVGIWKNQYPELSIETGAEISDDIPLALRSPKLLYTRSFFDDTMQLALDFPFKGVEIYYTLDEAASPTTQSPAYRDKIILDKTSHLRAFATKKGWANSPLVEAVFVKKKFSIASAELSNPPSPKYPAKGAVSLIDGKIADAQGADTWLGFEGEHLDATLDLGEIKEIGNVFVHCLENNAPWIFRPVGIQVSVSADGKSFKPQAKAFFPANTAMGEQKVHLLGCPFPAAAQARYVRVRVESPLKNPVWHPGKGQKCWIFVDEITVE